MRMHRSHRFHHVDSGEEEHSMGGVRLVAWARTVRWIGWGFGESLIPILIFGFSASFLEAGLFQASYEVVLLIILPFIGTLLDIVSARTMMLIALFLYPLIGLSYFLAGVLGVAFFVLLAKAINAFSWGIDGLAVDTYYRREAPRANLSSAFGYIDSISNLGWILAGLVGIFLVPYVSIPYLLLPVIPTALIAAWMVSRAPKDAIPKRERRAPIFMAYRTALRDFLSWRIGLRLLGLLVFFLGIIETLITFYIPIDARIEGAGLGSVILLGIIATIPCTFGYALGRYIDHRNAEKLLAASLLAACTICMLLALFPQYSFKLLASFFLGILVEFFVILSKKLMTVMSRPEEYGLRGGTFQSIGVLGNLAAPIILGVFLDLFGFPGTVLAIADMAFLMGIGFLFVRARHWKQV